MKIPSQKERSTYRSSVNSLNDWITVLETSLKRNLSLPSTSKRILYQLSGTNDLSNQLSCLISLRDRAEKQYLELLREAAPHSFSCFVEFMTPDEPPANHHEFLVDFLEAIERRDIMRGTVSIPPGHAKTKYCSRYFPACYLGRNPNHRYLQGGHSQDFAENEFGK